MAYAGSPFAQPAPSAASSHSSTTPKSAASSSRSLTLVLLVALRLVDRPQHHRQSCSAPTSPPASASSRAAPASTSANRLIAYTSNSTYGRALVVGFLNTLHGRRRRHHHRHHRRLHRRHRPAVAKLADRQDLHRLCRDLPQHPAAAGHLLLVFRRSRRAAAAARQLSICRFGSFLNNRGFYFPRTIWGDGSWLIPVAFSSASSSLFVVRTLGVKRQMATGQHFPCSGSSLGLIVGLPLLGLPAHGLRR